VGGASTQDGAEVLTFLNIWQDVMKLNLEGKEDKDEDEEHVGEDDDEMEAEIKARLQPGANAEVADNGSGGKEKGPEGEDGEEEDKDGEDEDEDEEDSKSEGFWWANRLEDKSAKETDEASFDKPPPPPRRIWICRQADMPWMGARAVNFPPPCLRAGGAFVGEPMAGGR
jgi:hypothetical protein